MAVAKPIPDTRSEFITVLSVSDRPRKPPPPIPKNLPFHHVSGSQTSILMGESDVGVSVAVTRQKAGNRGDYWNSGQ